MDELTPADELVIGIRFGDIATVDRVLASDPGIVSSSLGGRHGTRTALHVVTDWPGYFPNGPEIARMLLDAGGDPNAGRPDDETPLHWAASNDDVEVARVLVDGGADVDAPNGSIGTPLENAVGYGCWNVARLLVERGARVDKLWTAAALGMLDHVRELLAGEPAADDISQGFWHACGGGQRRAAELLLEAGADLHWSPEYAHGTALDAAHQLGTQQQNVITWLEERGATTQDG